MKEEMSPTGAGDPWLATALRITWLVITALGIAFFGLMPFVLGCLAQFCFRRPLPLFVVLLTGSGCFLALWQFTTWSYISYAGEDSFPLSFVFFLIFFSGGAAWVRHWSLRRSAA